MEDIVPIGECDVADKDSLGEYRRARARWIEWLNGKNESSVTHQICYLLWDDAVLRVVNEIGKITDKKPAPGTGMNWPVVRLLQRGFVALQCTCIRRLTDAEPDTASPSRGKSVVSLRRLVEDIEQNRHLITRENYVCHSGWPYDATRPNSRGQEFHAYAMSQAAHGFFDRLAGTTDADRRRDDLIDNKVFEHLKCQLGACAGIRRLVDKTIAHTADPKDPQTMKGFSTQDRAVTLRKLTTCYKALCEVAAFVAQHVLFDSGDFSIPTLMFDQFSDLDKPWATTETLERLRAFWDKHAEKVRSWSQRRPVD